MKNEIVITTSNGVAISGFSSESQARRFAELSIGKKMESLEVEEETGEPVKRHYRKRAPFSKWTPEEDRIIVENMGLGQKAVMSIPVLRKKHSKGAISGRFYNIKCPSRRHNVPQETIDMYLQRLGR